MMFVYQKKDGAVCFTTKDNKPVEEPGLVISESEDPEKDIAVDIDSQPVEPGGGGDVEGTSVKSTGIEQGKVLTADGEGGASWEDAGGNVESVNGQTGEVVLDKSDIGLGNVDNTSDADKPISTATQSALDNKQATLVSGTNIKTINNNSLVGSGDITINEGTTVVANPTLTGTESDLTGLQVGSTKYKVPQGGASLLNDYIFNGVSAYSVVTNSDDNFYFDLESFVDYLRDFVFCGIFGDTYSPIIGDLIDVTDESAYSVVYNPSFSQSLAVQNHSLSADGFVWSDTGSQLSYWFSNGPFEIGIAHGDCTAPGLLTISILGHVYDIQVYGDETLLSLLQSMVENEHEVLPVNPINFIPSRSSFGTDVLATSITLSCPDPDTGEHHFFAMSFTEYMGFFRRVEE